MKLSKKDIQISERIDILKGNSHLVKVMIRKSEFYLYFEQKKEEKEYKVYSISERQYENIKQKRNSEDSKEDYLGSMPVGEDEILWLCRMQNKKKVFGKIGKHRGQAGIAMEWCFILSGLVLFGIGVWRIGYMKQLEAREATVEGEIYDYSTHVMKGQFAWGHYNVYVRYTVDGKTYKGFNGVTAIDPTINKKMTVHYDSKNPANIIVKEESLDYTIYFVVVGVCLTIVGLSLVLSTGTKRKRN